MRRKSFGALAGVAGLVLAVTLGTPTAGGRYPRSCGSPPSSPTSWPACVLIGSGIGFWLRRTSHEQHTTPPLTPPVPATVA